MSSDENKYTEIGELSTDTSLALVGKIKGSSRFKSRSLLSPDSDRLLYNYASNVNVEDCAICEQDELHSEKIIFVGKNILTIYDTDSGNFYIENPRKILSKLAEPIEDGGLGLSEMTKYQDIISISKNLKYVFVVNKLVYIVSSKSNGDPVLFTLDPYTEENGYYAIKGLLVPEFNSSFAGKKIYCKPFEISQTIYIPAYDNNYAYCYGYNTNGGTEFVENANVSKSMFGDAVDGHYVCDVKGLNKIETYKDSINNRVWFFFMRGTNSIKVYDYQSSKTFNSPSIAEFTGHNIVQFNCFTSKSGTKYFVILLDNNKLVFIHESGLTVSTNVTTFVRTHGVVSYSKASIYNADDEFYILVKDSDGLTSAVYLKESDLFWTNKEIDVTEFLKTAIKPAFLTSISLNTKIHKQVIIDGYLNLIIGNYTESGNSLPLIKEFGIEQSAISDPIINRSFRTVMTKDNGVSLVKGMPYGSTQISRIHLFPEDMDTMSLSDNISLVDKAVSIKENTTDTTDYTTGSYIWNELAKAGLPYNTHVDVVGRIVIDGYDIPVEKVMITKALSGELYGDVLFTFDKLFDISLIRDALSEEVSQYPGVLFFKNNGFLQDAVISNSYSMEGNVYYNDATSNKIFERGISTITSSCKLDDTTLILGTNFGGIASVNIQTGAYRTISGTSSGDNPPIYYYPKSELSGNVTSIIVRNKKIFVVFNSNKIIKTTVGSNNWTTVVEGITTDTTKTRYIHKCVEVKENLLLISMVGGAIATYDMDSGVYTDPFASYTKKIPSLTGFSVKFTSTPASQMKLGNRLYFTPNNVQQLCWFDYITNTFGYVTLPDSSNIGAMLTTDGLNVYLLSDANGSSIVLRKYDPYTGTLSNLSSLPAGVINTHSGFYCKNNKLYLAFGIVSSTKYIYEYNLTTNVWIAYALNTTIPTVYNASSIEYTNESGKNIIRQMCGTLNKTTINFANLQNAFIDIDLSINLENSVSIVTNTSTVRYYGNKVYYNGINLYVSGGKSYTSSGNAVNGITKLSFDTSTKQSSYIGKSLSDFVGALVGDTIYEIGGSVTSENNVWVFDTRIKSWSNIKTLAMAATNEKDLISSMKVVGDKSMLLISYSSGAIGSMDLRTGEYYPPTTTTNRCVHKIFAKAGEVSDEGAVSIDEIGDDVYLNTPSRTIRWSSLIGAFFTENDKKFFKKVDDRNVLVNNLVSRQTMLFKKYITGSAKCRVGKYILFIGGYEYDKGVDSVHRGIVAYDTENNDFALLADGSQSNPDTGISTEMYNAFAYYNNGYIYTFGGVVKTTEYIVGEGKTRVIYRRSDKIGRYDLITAEEITNVGTFGFENKPVLSDFSSASIEHHENNWFIGTKEFRCLTEASDSRLMDVSAPHVTDGNRYLVGFVTNGETIPGSPNTNDAIQYLTAPDSNVSLKGTAYTNAMVVFDKNTETVKNYNGSEFNNVFNIDELNGIKVTDRIIPVERLYENGSEQYIVVFRNQTIFLVKLSLDTTISATVVDKYESAYTVSKAITQPIYDSSRDSIIINLIAENRVIAYDFNLKSFVSVKRDAYKSRFNPDANGTWSRPLLGLKDGLNISYIDDENYMYKERLLTDFVSSKASRKFYINPHTISGLYDLFMLGVESGDKEAETGIIKCGAMLYKGIFIKSSDTKYNSYSELGTAGKNRFVVLKCNPENFEVSVVVVENTKGTWSGKSDYIVRATVCDNIIWFIPKLGNKDSQSVSNVPNALYSFNPADISLSYHTITGDTIPVSLKTNIIMDQTNKIAHAVCATGGNDTDGFGLTDITFSGLSVNAHSESSSIDCKVLSETVTSGDKKSAVVNGVIFKDGSYRLYIALIDNVSDYSEKIRILDGKLKDDFTLFDDGGTITNNTEKITRVYGSKNIAGYDIPKDIISVTDDDVVLKIVTYGGNLTETIYKIFDKGMYFKDEFITSGYGTKLSFKQISKDTANFIVKLNDHALENLVYTVQTRNVGDRYRRLVKDFDLFDMTSSTTIKTYSGKDVGYIYNDTTKKLYVFDYVNREISEIADFSDDSYGKLTAISDNETSFAITDGSGIVVFDKSSRRVKFTKRLSGASIISLAMNDKEIAAINTNKIYTVNFETGVVWSIDTGINNNSKIIYNESAKLFKILSVNNTVKTVVTGRLISELTMTTTGLTDLDRFTCNAYKFTGSAVYFVYDNNDGLLLGSYNGTPYLNIKGVIFSESKIVLLTFDTTTNKLVAVELDKLYKNIETLPTVVDPTGYTFASNGSIYSVENDSLYKLNKDTKSFEIITSLDITGKIIHVKTDSTEKATVVVIKTGDAGTVGLEFRTIDLVNKSDLGSVTVSVNVAGASGSTLNVVASDNSLFVGKYFITTLGVNGSSSVVNVCIDPTNPTGTVYSTDTTLKIKTSLAYADGSIYNMNGSTGLNSSGVSTGKFVGFGESSLPILTGSVNDSTVTIGAPADIVSVGPLLKSGNKIVGKFIAINDIESERVVGRSQCNILHNSVAGSDLSKYSDWNGNIGLGIANLSNANKSLITECKQMPLEDDIAYVKFNGNKGSAVSIPKSPIRIFKYNDFIVRIYSGLSSDLFITMDSFGNIIDTLNAEREYGLTISDILADPNMITLFYDGSSNISSLIIHDDGFITMKDYNGVIFGRSIDPSTSNCPVQELDIVAMFDDESSEFGMGR